MPTVHYIPTGTKNLLPLFPAADWNNIEEYFIEVVNQASAVIASSNVLQVDQCRDTDDTLRIHFLNYAGTIDALNFGKVSQEHEVKSDSFEKSLPNTFSRSAHGLSRTSVVGNDTFTGQIIVPEDQQEYMDEILDSPLAWLEWKGKQGQPDDYLAIVINDVKSIKFQQDDRFLYVFTVEFKYSQPKITIRN